MYLQVKGCKLFVNISTPNRGQQHPIPLDDAVSYLKGLRCVLLMHGFPDTADMWVDQIAALSAAGFAAIAPDMPGYGKSAFTHADDVQQYSLRNIVAIMCGMLDQLGVQQTAVVGHDWGAAVAWTFAMQAPQRMTQLVVLSVGHPGGGAAVDPRQRAHWWYQLFFCLPGAEAAVTANSWSLFRQIMGRNCSQQQLDTYVKQLSQPGALTSALNWHRANTHPRHFGATTPLPAHPNALIAVPTLGVWSAADTALLEPQMLASSTYVAPGLRQYNKLEGVGHWIARDASQQLNKILLNFLQQQQQQQQQQQPPSAAAKLLSRLGRLSPQQMVMCVRALGRLDVKAIDIHSCIAFPAWMHNYTASLAPRLSELSGFELVKLMLGFSMLGYKPAWSFLNSVATAVEPKLSGLDTVHLTCLLSSWSTLKYEPEPSVMRSVMGEVYAKLPLFDDKDLTTALTAFCSMRHMLRKDVLADFVAQVSTKMATFSPRELAGVLVALGHLGYTPGPEWFAQATECFRGRLQTANNASTFALIAQGLLTCGHDPEPWLVNELITASSPKVSRMDINDLQTLAHAISKFSYRPEPGSAAFKSWQRWFERVGHVVSKQQLLTKQAMVFLEAMCDAGLPPDPNTTEHLVLQMVSNGLNKAPVAHVVRLLDVLKMAQQQAGGQFLTHYANTLRLVVTQLSAHQIAAAMRSLANEGYVPQSWWVVCMLAAAHTRFEEFDGRSAADLLWSVAKLCQNIQLPSEKWVQDFAGKFWAGVAQVGQEASGTSATSAVASGTRGDSAAAAAAAAGRGGNGRANRYVQQPGSPWGQGESEQPDRTPTAQQLGLGLWGAVTIGFRPTDEQWVQWEAAAKSLGWGVPLDAVQAAVLGYKVVGRTLPRELSQQLQKEKAQAQASAQKQVEAAAAAKAQAARQLAVQQQRMQQAAAAVAAFQAQQQQQQMPGRVGSPEATLAAR